MDNDDLQEVDVRNTLKGRRAFAGGVRERELDLPLPQRLGAVIRFLSEIRARVITAYRIKKKK